MSASDLGDEGPTTAERSAFSQLPEFAENFGIAPDCGRRVRRSDDDSELPLERVQLPYRIGSLASYDFLMGLSELTSDNYRSTTQYIC
jgi:hypothetical protein